MLTRNFVVSMKDYYHARHKLHTEYTLLQLKRQCDSQPKPPIICNSNQKSDYGFDCIVEGYSSYQLCVNRLLILVTRDNVTLDTRERDCGKLLLLGQSVTETLFQFDNYLLSDKSLLCHECNSVRDFSWTQLYYTAAAVRWDAPRLEEVGSAPAAIVYQQ